MSSAQMWIMGLVLAGAGFGAGYLAGGAGGDGPDMDMSLQEPEADAPGPDDVTPMHAEGAALRGTGSDNTLAAALASLPAVAPTPGDGVITGTIKDGGGQPVEGVEVTLRPRRTRVIVAPGPEDPEARMLRQVREMVARERWNAAHLATVQTGADGTYRGEGLIDTGHSVSAKKAGYKLRTTDRRAGRSAKPGATVDFQATAIATLVLDIVGVDPLPEMLVARLVSGNRSSGYGWRPGGAPLELEPGNFTLTVTGGEDNEYKSQPQAITLEAGSPTRVSVTLESSPVLKLSVVYPQGERTGAQVIVLRMTGTSLPSPEALQARGKSHSANSRRHRRGASGPLTITIPGLKPGAHAVGVSRGHNRGIGHIERVDVTAGLVEHEIQMPALDQDEYVVVRVEGTDGKPVRDARISTGYFSKTSSSSGGSLTADREDGSILVMHHASGIGGGDQDGTFWVEARGAHGSKRVEYQRGKTREILIQLEEPGHLEIHVGGVKGSIYAGRVELSLTGAAGAPNRSSRAGQTVLDESGGGKLMNVQPGRYTATLSIRQGKRMMGSPVYTEEVVITSGVNDFSARLPTLYAVTLHGASGHIWVRVPREGRTSAHPFHLSTQVGKTGTVLVDGLAAGRYTAQSGQKQATFTVPGASEVTLEEPK